MNSPENDTPSDKRPNMADEVKISNITSIARSMFERFVFVDRNSAVSGEYSGFRTAEAVTDEERL